MHSTPKATIVTMGCSKNLVDSEQIGAQLQQSGWRVCYDAEPTAEDVLLINTCGFIGDAKEESIEMLWKASLMRAAGAVQKVVVFGCLSQRYLVELKEGIPHIDSWYGVTDQRQLLAELGVTAQGLEERRLLSTPKHYGYLKISEGCNKHCSFCAIPNIRGRYTSRSIDSLVREASALVEGGTKELLLIAQDLTYFGYDRQERDALPKLLARLEEIPALEWIRLHYAYPSQVSDALIEQMVSSKKICPYLDIPLQHIAPRILTAMHRASAIDTTRPLLAKLRQRIPDLTIRTTFLVGFPGETEEEFAQLEEFVQEVAFDHLGVFTYSEEEGTPAQQRYTDDVPAALKAERQERIMQLQAPIAQARKLRHKGRVLPVIVDDRLHNGQYIGRTQHDSPEVDGEVLIHTATPLQIGEILPITITGVEGYDLIGHYQQ